VKFFSELALILLTLVGYSSGAVIGGRNKTVAPELLDLVVAVVLWALALASRPFLGRWTAIGVLLVGGGLVSFVLAAVRRGKMPARKVQPPSGSGNLLQRVWERWKNFTTEMGNYQGRMLLAFFYFVVVTPFGALVRLLGDPLRTKRSASTSFWIDRSTAKTDLDEARRQF
jgi:hypothetical protein